MPNQDPVITSANIATFAENGTGTVYTVTATDADPGTTLIYSLSPSGADTNLFNINSSNGVVTFKTAPDFEAPSDDGANNIYDINVIVNDGTVNTVKAVSIQVTNVNDAPTNLTLSTSTVEENKAVGTVVGNLSSTGQDIGNTFIYSLVTGTGATDNSLFTITNNQLKTNAVFDFETQTIYSIRVKTTDQGGLSFEKQLNININDINEAPTDLLLDNTAIAEGQPIGAVIGNLISTDPDTGNTFTYSLVTGTGATDNSLFTITNNQLKTNAVFDFETQTIYSIRVKTEDQDGLSFERQLNINVNDINEAPTDLLLDNTAIAEGQTDGVIGNLSSIDPDTGNTFTYSLVAGTGDTENSLFSIVDNQLIANTVFDFETQTIYSIRVKTEDQDGLSFERQLNINVNDINEAPTDLLLDNTAIAEGQTDGVIGNLSSIDPDTGNFFTYSLVAGTGDTENSLFSIVDNQLIANTVFDFETQTIYSIRVKTEDQDGLSFEKQLNINVNDINEAPTDLLLDNTAIAEGQTDGVIGNLSSTDPDTGNTFTYSLVTGDGDTENSLFSIVDNQLIALTVFDFETQTSYSIRVKTEDQDGLSFERQLNINVNDINEAPTDLLLDNTAIAEGQTDGVIGNLSSTDPDTGNTFTYSLVTGDGDTENSLFSIVDNQLIALTVFDFETQTSYSIRVKTEDQDGLSFEKQLNINVNDINEAPTDLSYDNTTDTTTIDERKPIGTVVGNLSSTDPDTGNTFTYRLVTGDGATDNSLFTIVDNQLQTNSVFNFETKNSYRIRVKTTDQGGLSFEKQLTIGVTDVPEPPTLNRPSSGNTFVLNGDSNERLEVKLTGYNSKLNSELGVFTVDDADGKIDGIAPGAPGYTEKALQRGQVIFSLLGNPPSGFNQSSLSRLLESNSGNLRFYLVKDGSTDSVLNNTTPKTNVLFDISSNVRTTTSGNGLSLAWEDGSGNPTGFEDLQVTITPTDIIPTDTVISQVTSLQNKPQGELLDLRGINGPVTANFVVNREAAYNNFVGFYKVNDENGGIDTDGNGTIDVRPGATGYAQAALKARVLGLDLTVNNNGTKNVDKTLQGGSFFAPFIITNGGTPDNYDNINSRIYFTFGAANSDGVDHVRLLGDNTFGFEDLAGGGDNDFNDVIVKVNLTV